MAGFNHVTVSSAKAHRLATDILKQIDKIFINFPGEYHLYYIDSLRVCYSQTIYKFAFFTDFIREGAANAVRHGFAAEVFVTCAKTEEGFRMSVANSGVAPAGSITEGGGIKALRRKLDELGGELSVTMRPRFTVTATIRDLREGRAKTG